MIKVYICKPLLLVRDEIRKELPIVRNEIRIEHPFEDDILSELMENKRFKKFH